MISLLYVLFLCAFLLILKRTLNSKDEQRTSIPGPPSLGPYVAKLGPKASQWVLLHSVQEDFGQRRLHDAASRRGV